VNISWITLRVDDMDSSIMFYRDFLGLVIEREFGDDEQKIVFFGEKGRTLLELIWRRDGKNDEVGGGVSIGFEVSNLNEWIDKYRKVANGSVSDPFSPNPHIRFCFVSDPDGYQIQLCESIYT
jgi:lactoylglutathione lyase